MNHLNEILSISPLPIVSLENESKPMSGALTPLSSFCHRKYSESSACHDHYAGLKSKQVGQCVQCPHGLSSYPMAIGSVKYAFTGFIPYPRSGGHQERQLAKQLPEHKISRTTLDRYAGFLQGVYKNLLTAGESVIRQYSFALHEIRKLNRTIKQTIERMQMEDYQWFESADNDLTRVFKSSEMMSTQFDVVELIANQNFATLPLTARSQVHRLFDKCARIHSPEMVIAVRSSSGIEPYVMTCDKTITIIPTVLLSNALKYRLPNTQVEVDIGLNGGNVQVRVQNRVEQSTRIDERVFNRGFRGVVDGDGSGHGLFLAKLVAEQHKGSIELVENGERGIVAFLVRLPAID